MNWNHWKHLKGNLWLNLNKLRLESLMSHPNVLISLVRQNFAFHDGSSHCKAHRFLRPFPKWHAGVAKKGFWRNPEGLWQSQFLEYWAWINWSLPLIKLLKTPNIYICMCECIWNNICILFCSSLNSWRKYWGFSDMCVKIKFLVL